MRMYLEVSKLWFCYIFFIRLTDDNVFIIELEIGVGQIFCNIMLFRYVTILIKMKYE